MILLGAGPLVLSQMEHPPVEDPPRRELSRSMSGGERPRACLRTPTPPSFLRRQAASAPRRESIPCVLHLLTPLSTFVSPPSRGIHPLPH